MNMLRRIVPGAALALALSGCAVVQQPSTGFARPQSTFQASGNWEFLATSWVNPYGDVASPGNLSGVLLEQPDGTVTGSLSLALDPASPCMAATQDTISVAGTVDVVNHLALTSAPFAGNTLKLDLYSAGGKGGDGSYLITGGACAVPSTQLRGYAVAPLAPSFSGTLGASAPVPGLNASLQIAAATTADAGGNYALSGAASFSGSGCSVTAPSLTGQFSGARVLWTGAASGTSGASLSFLGSVDPSGNTLTGWLTPSASIPGCFGTTSLYVVLTH